MIGVHIFCAAGYFFLGWLNIDKWYCWIFAVIGGFQVLHLVEEVIKMRPELVTVILNTIKKKKGR